MGDYRTTSGESLPEPKKLRRRRWLRRLLTVGIGATALIGAVWKIRVDRYVVAAGYVTTEHYAEVRSPTVGIVAEIVVRTGAQIEKGDLMVRLDDTQQRATLEQAQSQVRKAEAQLSRREAEIRELQRKLREDIAIAKLRLGNATTKVVRTRELLKKGLVAASALEDAKLNEELARAQLTSLLSRDETVYDKELAVLRQELQGQRDAEVRAEAQVRARQIRAPIAGRVLRYEFVIGELVRPEQVLYEIFGGDQQVLKLRIGERYATRVAVGQRYRATLAPYSGLQKVWFEGKIKYLRNVIQADGKRTYRVAYCSFDPQGRTVPPGTTAEARVYYGRSSLLLYLLGVD
ncbi:MAG: HlyD family efflux transporter periplasmic adaptor subunit [Kiritimatiellaeota bacterium]|nr:HlyD family efflux transporter periplasmic adaptor subunit [Kiritimatiellota bacterium]